MSWKIKSWMQLGHKSRAEKHAACAYVSKGTITLNNGFNENALSKANTISMAQYGYYQVFAPI